MPYWRLFYHMTYGVKERLPLIRREFERSLHNVIAAKVMDLGGRVYAVGGVEDHVHLAASIPPKIAVAEFVGQIKGSSSHWINHVIKPGFHFAWQHEYGVVSFGVKNLPYVVQYVKHQHEHHCENSVQSFLERCDE